MIVVRPPAVAPSPEQKREALERILQSQTFARSEQLRAFLAYVCEVDLKGDGANLNEYLIGVDVLGRPQGYSTADDASVRTRAHALRRKLQDYYLHEDQGALLRIEIPKGGYCPQYIPGGAAPDSAAPRSMPVETGPVQILPAQNQPAQIPSLHKSSRLPWLAAMLLLLLILLPLAFFAGRYSLHEPLPVEIAEAWGPLLTSKSPVLICLATPFHLLIRPAPPEAENNLYRPLPPIAQILSWYSERQKLQPGENLFMNYGHNSPLFGDVSAAVSAITLLGRHRVAYEVLPERIVSPFTMRNRNVLLIGRPEYSQGVALLLQKAWFNIAYHRPASGMAVYAPGKTPSGRDFIVSPTHAFGLISVIPQRAPDGGLFRTVIVSGVNSAGSHAAAEFLSSPQHLAALATRFRQEGHSSWPASWQVVVRTKADSLLPFDVQYHAHRVLTP
jgi:hypothetical protein